MSTTLSSNTTDTPLPNVDTPLGAMSSKELVRAIYRGVLGRQPDQTGLAAWERSIVERAVDALPGGLDAMLRSPEFARRWRIALSPDARFYHKRDDDVTIVDFADAIAARVLGDGWHTPERSWVWAGGEDSLLHLPVPSWTDAGLLYLVLKPIHHPQAPSAQRIQVSVNGTIVAEEALTGTHPRVLMCPIPAGIIAARSVLTIRLRHPDGIIPNEVDSASQDTRRLAIQLREVRLDRLTPARAKRHADVRAAIDAPLHSSSGRTPAEESAPLDRFESLGANCEFGFVARNAGFEGVSLLRFNGIPLHKLVRGLRTGFAGIASPEYFTMRTIQGMEDQGIIGHDALYLMDYHSGRPASDLGSPTLITDETARMRFLARKLIEDVEDGEKIFVLKQDEPLLPEQVVALLEVMRLLGNATLLWVDFAKPGHEAGSVDVIEPGLMKGYIDHFARLDEGLDTISYDCWSEILSNAWALRSEARFISESALR